MKKEIVFFLFILSAAACALDFEVGVSQWNRIEYSGNTAAAAPGVELFTDVYLDRNQSVRGSVYAGRLFGTVAGAEISYMYRWRLNSWVPLAGCGFYAVYKDVIFHTTSSYDYIPPRSFGTGLLLHMKPFRWIFGDTTFSVGGVSAGLDLTEIFQIYEFDVRIFEMGIRFGEG